MKPPAHAHHAEPHRPGAVYETCDCGAVRRVQTVTMAHPEEWHACALCCPDLFPTDTHTQENDR